MFYFCQCTSNTPSVTFSKVDSIKNTETIDCFSKFEADPKNCGLDIIKQLSKSET